MRALTQEQIHTALGRLGNGPERYACLQERFQRCNVATDREFQTIFNGFYRVRRNLSWRSDYYELMESSKESGIEFPQALREIARRTNRIEASFASKLVATIDPSKPVIDKFVLENFGLRLPRRGVSDREARTIDVYKALCQTYEDYLRGPTGTLILKLFDRRFPDLNLTDLKKTDLVLWQVR
jgi:hypothetical protein